MMENTKELFYDWMGANTWLFKLVNSLTGNSLYDRAMLTITQLGDRKILPYFLVGLIVFVSVTLIARKLQKKGGSIHFAAMWFGILLVLVVGYGVNRASVEYLKDYYSYPRPYLVLASEDIHYIEPPKDDAYSHRSFPSGHMSQICVLVFGLWPALFGKGRWLGVWLIVAVGWSRLALGVHYPADLVGALLLAALEIFLIRNILYWLLHKIFGIKC